MKLIMRKTMILLQTLVNINLVCTEEVLFNCSLMRISFMIIDKTKFKTNNKTILINNKKMMMKKHYKLLN